MYQYLDHSYDDMKTQLTLKFVLHGMVWEMLAVAKHETLGEQT